MAREKYELPPRPSGEVWESTPPEVRDAYEGLEKLVGKLLGAVSELRGSLEQLQREKKRQATPFRRKKRVQNRKKPGRKGGHSQERRTEPERVDDELDASTPTQCPCCGGSEIQERGCYEQIQEDLVTKPVTRRFTIHHGVCQDCGHEVEGRHPFQTSTARGAAAQHIGPWALAVAAKLHYGQGVPFDKVREHLADMGLKVSTSTLVRAMERVALRGAASFQTLLADVLSQQVLHIDETGWSVDGTPCWLWVISGADATIYFVRETRGSCEVEDFLKDFAGVLVTDGAKAYDKLGKTLTRALCLLHLRRNVRALEANQTGGAVCVPRALDRWLTRAIDLVSRRATLEPDAFALESSELQRSFDDVFARCQPTNEANASMIERIVKWQDAILRCLRDDRVPATNNHAERQVRPAVVLRKRGGCNRSQRGAQTFEILTSLLVSARQRGVDFIDWFVQLMRQPDPRAAAPLR
ncbi:MAG: IS66 family transposase [Sandaracinaceae bacterium]|nr:IS66 family transposase [Sandaracinaceae bacterium]